MTRKPSVYASSGLPDVAEATGLAYTISVGLRGRGIDVLPAPQIVLVHTLGGH